MAAHVQLGSYAHGCGTKAAGEEPLILYGVAASVPILQLLLTHRLSGLFMLQCAARVKKPAWIQLQRVTVCDGCYVSQRYCYIPGHP
jgi:hypothetical protein